MSPVSQPGPQSAATNSLGHQILHREGSASARGVVEQTAPWDTNPERERERGMHRIDQKTDSGADNIIVRMKGEVKGDKQLYGATQIVVGEAEWEKTAPNGKHHREPGVSAKRPGSHPTPVPSPPPKRARVTTPPLRLSVSNRRENLDSDQIHLRRPSSPREPLSPPSLADDAGQLDKTMVVTALVAARKSLGVFRGARWAREVEAKLKMVRRNEKVEDDGDDEVDEAVGRMKKTLEQKLEEARQRYSRSSPWWPRNRTGGNFASGADAVNGIDSKSSGHEREEKSLELARTNTTAKDRLHEQGQLGQAKPWSWKSFDGAKWEGDLGLNSAAGQRVNGVSEGYRGDQDRWASGERPRTDAQRSDGETFNSAIPPAGGQTWRPGTVARGAGAGSISGKAGAPISAPTSSPSQIPAQVALVPNRPKFQADPLVEAALKDAVGEDVWSTMREADGGRRFEVWGEVVGSVGEASNLLTSLRTSRANLLRRLSHLSASSLRRHLVRSHNTIYPSGRRLVRDLASFWRRNEREERERQRRAEREELERRRREEEDRETRRAGRKLEFLIKQTELYSHFVAKKSGGEVDLDATGVGKGKDPVGSSLDFATVTDDALNAQAKSEALAAVARTRKAAKSFDEDHRRQQREAEAEREGGSPISDGATAPVALAGAIDEMLLGAPDSEDKPVEVGQPRMLTVPLKPYQLKGLSWLVNLYEQGINGILADEMGLGKTIQSISLMAYLAETHDIWGPFLVVAPVSTLHNWQQEIAKFAPSLRVLPYWGNANDRKVLRKFWQRRKLRTRDAPFHVLVTSYQLVLTDEVYFQKLKVRLITVGSAFNASRLIVFCPASNGQNSMQELWALLHFIMPSFFDSHTEFAEWFSKDIEAHSKDSKSTLNADQLRRLHMILRPFMLRRIKRDVETELGEKIERDVLCTMTLRQKRMYEGLREKITLQELLQRADLNERDAVSSLMNLVMQLRKVCNHPELFARAEVRTPLQVCELGGRLSTPSVGKGGDLEHWVSEAPANPILLEVPRLIYDAGLVNMGADNTVRKRSLTFGVADHLRNIWRPEYIAETMKTGISYGTFDFSRLLGLSPLEVSDLILGTPAERAVRNLLLSNAAKSNPLREPKGTLQDLLVCDPLEDDFGSTLHICTDLSRISKEFAAYSILRRRPVFMPAASAPPINLKISSHRFVNQQADALLSADSRALVFASTWLNSVNPSVAMNVKELCERTGLHLESESKQGFTNVVIPNPIKIVTDSGKMHELDVLLARLKSEGHRVLIFFQMTKMIDLFEEYCSYRNYRYLRLDGSTAITDRNAMVSDWQSKPEYFIFLLSTRAGGLGINLTAADTVIFYDCDWNPTVDQQAMDRCHRLGQTKTVTVYKLITRGTIEERIQIRTKQKTQVQKTVISGGEFEGTVQFKPREIASLFMDEGEMDMSAQPVGETQTGNLDIASTKTKRGRPQKIGES
ncbi:putative DNA helicase ino80 [Gonapodya sp. JEL0774]|nr:putative DNA helicase ino80 [Gonapodya sp. JEL0774]